MEKAQNGVGVSQEGVAYTLDGTGAQAVGVHVNQHHKVRTSSLAGSLNGSLSGTQYEGVFTSGSVRRLTPLECERLQGFPDGWTEGFSDSVRYRFLGNAVAVPVAGWVLRRVAARGVLPGVDGSPTEGA